MNAKDSETLGYSAGALQWIKTPSISLLRIKPPLTLCTRHLSAFQLHNPVDLKN
jgi:hypothetical protein